MRIVLGLLGVILSILLIVYRYRVREFTGQFTWAENKLGAGGTYIVLVLVGILGFFFSLTYMTDSFGLILGGLGLKFFDSAE